MGPFGVDFHSKRRSTLLRATMKGVFLSLRRRMDSRVCGSSKCMISTTRIAISHKFDPRARKLVKLSCPGVSIMSSPGILALRDFPVCLTSSSVAFSIFFIGKYVAPICWVIPPASRSWTLVLRILSKSFVFPVSTWPRMQQIGLRSSRLSFLFFLLSPLLLPVFLPFLDVFLVLAFSSAAFFFSSSSFFFCSFALRSASLLASSSALRFASSCSFSSCSASSASASQPPSSSSASASQPPSSSASASQPPSSPSSSPPFFALAAADSSAACLAASASSAAFRRASASRRASSFLDFGLGLRFIGLFVDDVSVGSP
mmetsp:Transcript_2451/g.3537  ORF Transcript_2451/g.3537 Transcript_2451/m.3537 type:complete len:316 (-) Transcript_2451:1604-2551(-)